MMAGVFLSEKNHTVQISKTNASGPANLLSGREVIEMVKRIILLTVLAAGAAVFAQPGMGPGRNYDASKEQTVSGKVTAVQRIAHGGRSEGMHLTLQTAGGQVVVLLGPVHFIDKSSLKIKEGDELTVTGARQDAMLIAREVRKGSEVLQLRTAAGVPLWGRGQR